MAKISKGSGNFSASCKEFHQPVGRGKVDSLRPQEKQDLMSETVSRNLRCRLQPREPAGVNDFSPGPSLRGLDLEELAHYIVVGGHGLELQPGLALMQAVRTSELGWRKLMLRVAHRFGRSGIAHLPQDIGFYPFPLYSRLKTRHRDTSGSLRARH